jgi:segregation and condensation protein A
MILKDDHFTLTHFEGSLDFLLCLIQKEEIDIYDVTIQDLIQQFIIKLAEWESRQLDKGAEFIGTAAYLVWLKSKMLLPRDEQIGETEVEGEDPHFEIIHHLIDYCRFKQAAKELTVRQEKQQACYFRGVDAPEWKKPLGIDHVSLDELASLFQEMAARAVQAKPQIQEEHWRVSDKMQLIRLWLKEEDSFLFHSLFASSQSRLEMIVCFLAILELMKIGELAIGCEQTSGQLVIFAKREGSQ